MKNEARKAYYSDLQLTNEIEYQSDAISAKDWRICISLLYPDFEW